MMTTAGRAKTQTGRNGQPTTTRREDLISSCLPMVTYFARRLAPRSGGFDFEDIVSEGYIGLVRAANNFDPARGNSFSTLAAISIRGAIIDAFRKSAPNSRRRLKELRAVAAARSEMTSQLGRQPEDPEVAQRLNIDIERIRRLRERPASGPISLEEYLDRTAGQDLPSDDSTEDMAMNRILAWEMGTVLAELGPREAEIIRRHYIMGQPQKQIAVEMGLSESRISQLTRRGLGQLRVLLEARQRLLAA